MSTKVVCDLCGAEIPVAGLPHEGVFSPSAHSGPDLIVRVSIVTVTDRPPGGKYPKADLCNDCTKTIVQSVTDWR